MSQSKKKGKLANRYDNLVANRSAVLYRARQGAKLTIPALMPEEGTTETSDLPQPFQSLGARGVTSLAARLMNALFPPNRPFFKYVLSAEAKTAIEESEFSLSDVNQKLEENERKVMRKFETSSARQSVFQAIQQIINAGNALVKMEEDTSIKTYRLDQYVGQRDTVGHVKEIITHDNVAWESLDKDVQARVPKPKDTEKEPRNDSKVGQDGTVGSGVQLGNDLDLYTRISRKDGKWVGEQEIEGVEFKQGEWKVSPYFPVRWIGNPGENYGRGHVEENIGDLAALDNLSEAILSYAAAASRNVVLVNPTGLTKKDEFASAENGDVIDGRKEDVNTHTLDKFGDMNVVAQTAQNVEQRIGIAFMLNTAVQRQGDRVTATEIRVAVAELEGTLGGVFSHLASEFQAPLIKRLTVQMQKNGDLAVLPEGVVDFEIITGLEALSREQDLVKLQTLVQIMAQMPEKLLARLNAGTYLTRVMTALGIDSKDLIHSEEEFQRMIAQEQQNAAALQGASAAAQSGGEIAGEAIAREALT